MESDSAKYDAVLKSIASSVCDSDTNILRKNDTNIHPKKSIAVRGCTIEFQHGVRLTTRKYSGIRRVVSTIYNGDSMLMGKLFADFDSDDRIKCLSIRLREGKGILSPYVQVAIGGLERLKRLSLVHCEFHSHRWLSQLSHLEILILERLTYTIASFPKLLRLEKLYLLNVSLPSSQPLFLWINENLPHLKSLHLIKLECDPDCFQVPKSLRRQTSLESISITQSSIDEDQLSNILFEILPIFPSVSQISLRDNNVRSFRSIANKLVKINKSNSINGSNSFTFESSVRQLELSGNPIEKNYRDPDESAALCLLLREFPTIAFLPITSRTIKDRSSDIQYELLLNLTGRKLVRSSDSKHPLPLSVWPLVLARLNSPQFLEKAGRTVVNFPSDDHTFPASAWSLTLPKTKSTELFEPPVLACKGDRAHVAMAFFYFLREGPVLLGRDLRKPQRFA